jgi:uncharacterized membrane protein YcaP (DUF421 family)
MDKLRVFDFHRIFIGDLPATFMLEIVFRTLIMYAYTIVLLRFLGKRGMGQLSTLEVAIIICFGSAVGDPMLGIDVPILHGMIAITTIAFLQVGMERVINRNKRIEMLMEGKADCLVNNGVIMVDVLKKNNLSHEDLFRGLRDNEVKHLGQVYKAFFETSGSVSVMFHPSKNIKAGLSVMPEELVPPSAFSFANDQVEIENIYCCNNCGNPKLYKEGQLFTPCKHCSCVRWVKAEI